MSPTVVPSKTMTIGEGGSALAFAAGAVLCLVIAINAYTPTYAFHAYLFAAAGVAALLAVVKHYRERPAALPPLTIAGKPNYNMGPVKFTTVAAMFWGIAGMAVGVWIALELAYRAYRPRGFPVVAAQRPIRRHRRCRTAHPAGR
jgi:cytochrome c oxidase cbb3-type subunit I